MRILFRRTLLAATLAIAGLLHASFHAPRARVTIVITGLRSNKGAVLVSLFDNARSFPDKADRAVGKSRVAIRDKTVRVTFPDLPPGKYAAAILHDENNNLKMDYNLVGMPKEGYGFSNNATGNFGPPSFGKAAFLLSGPETTTTIKASYFP